MTAELEQFDADQAKVEDYIKQQRKKLVKERVELIQTEQGKRKHKSK
jgi:hypothetical protein